MEVVVKNSLFMVIKDKIPGVVFFKPLVFILCLTPFLLLIVNALNNELGPNPVEEMIRTLGDWAIYFILIGLTITPARKVFKLNWLIRYRRMTGLFAFFYVCMHFLSYIWFDQFFSVEDIVKDIIKRPFITIGFISFLLLIPLAVTSTNGMMKRLKKKLGTITSVSLSGFNINLTALFYDG